ncbi:MAG TPA: protein kinase, partial [Solimonas sp.]|nr:protein kinase [Solimonas sp.]
MSGKQGPLTMIHNIGKFEVRRLLGRGGQSQVFLAHDPDLQREVAIKRLNGRTAPGRTASVHAEARTVSRLRHPNIVPIFEMGEQDGQVHLVFEYVAGQTLQQLLAQSGALPTRRAVELMAAVLEAIEQAHAEGIIHRDLKPSNILIEKDGRPRVMDFGIAAKPSPEPGLEQDLLGTPAYMAPEYVTHRVVTEQYDVFSAGLILYEMLCGRRAVQGDNPFQAIHQIANVPLVFPADAVERIDSRLHEILAKATAKEPELRYASAKQMREALQEYLKPTVETAADSGHQSTLEFLLRRMRVKSDFPAMSTSINAIQRLAASDKADVNNLSNSILKDFALTNKILRLVNSAYYPNRSGERIRTVSRAIVMLGFDAVRGIAISLMLFDHIRDKKHAGALKEEFLRANLGGMLAREL